MPRGALTRTEKNPEATSISQIITVTPIPPCIMKKKKAKKSSRYSINNNRDKQLAKGKLSRVIIDA